MNLGAEQTVLEVFRHAEFKCGLYFGRSLFLKEVVKSLVNTRQLGFPELRPYCKQSEMQSIIDSFGNKNWKKQ